MCSLDYQTDKLLKGTALEKIRAEDLCASVPTTAGKEDTSDLTHLDDPSRVRRNSDIQKMLMQILSKNEDVLSS